MNLHTLKQGENVQKSSLSCRTLKKVLEMINSNKKRQVIYFSPLYQQLKKQTNPPRNSRTSAINRAKRLSNNYKLVLSEGVIR